MKAPMLAATTAFFLGALTPVAGVLAQQIENQPPNVLIPEPTARQAALWAPQDTAVLVEPAPLVAEVGLAMTLAELESIALANNPTLVQAAMRIEAAEGKRLQAGLRPNPTIGYVGEEMGAGGTAGQQGAFVVQEFLTAKKRQLRASVAGHEITEAQHAFDAQRRRVLNDVAVGWFEVLVAQRVVELNQRLVRIGHEGVDAAEKLLGALEVSRVDVLQAKIEADTARLKLHDSKNRHLAAWRRLAAVIGQPDMAPATLDGALEEHVGELTWGDSLGRLLSESPELAAAQAGVSRAQCELARQCAERVPNVEVGARVLYHHPDEKTVATLEFGMPLTIFDRNQGNIAKARAELVVAEREVGRLELVLQQRLATVFARYANARHEAQKYAADILPNAKASLELVDTGYRQGEFDYLKLLTAQRTYFQVNLAYLESLLEVRTASVQIEGLLLTGGLGGAAGE